MPYVEKMTKLRLVAGAIVVGLMASYPAFAASTSDTHGSIQANGVVRIHDAVQQASNSPLPTAGSAANNDGHGSIQATGVVRG